METVLFFGILILGIVLGYLAGPLVDSFDFLLLMLVPIIGAVVSAVSVAVFYFVWGF